MLTDNIRPKTIDGMKSLARTIKKREGIKHAEALDKAALQAGYSNFRNAQKNILRENPLSGKVPIYISAGWLDRGTKTSGREVLEIHIDNLILETLKPSNFKNCNYLWHFIIRASDHLEMKARTNSQYRARQSIVQAARALQFMAATGLRPSRSDTKAVANNNHYNALPKRDHSTTWFDPETKRYLLVDEPYEASIRNEFEKRQHWAKRFEFAIKRPDWAGIYYPDGGSVMELVSHSTKGVPLEPIVNALNKCQNPIVRENSNWIEPPVNRLFSSPEERKKQSQVTSKLVPKKKRAKSISYNTIFSSGYIRPPEKMPIEAHKEIGLYLKSAYSISSMRQGARNAINSVRSTLDDWVQIEYDRKFLPDSEFFDVYYHGPSPLLRKPNLEENGAALGDLHKAQTIIEKHYPDCTARDQILNKLGKAYNSLSSWKLS